MSLPVIVERTDAGLISVFGGDSGDIATIASDLKSGSAFLHTIEAALTAVSTATSVLNSLLVGIADGPAALIRVIVQNITARIEDLRKTGIYMLPIGFSIGPPGSIKVTGKDVTVPTATLNAVIGLGGLRNTLSLALLNARDPHRPSFGPDAYTSGTLIVGFGLQADAVELIRQLFESVFFRPVVLAAMNLQAFYANSNPQKTFNDAYEAYRLANSPISPAVTPWTFQTVETMLPAVFGDFLLEVEARLNALLTLSISLKGLDAFVKLVQAALQEIQDLLRLLDSLLVFLNLLLTKFPILQFRWSSVGGAAEIAASLNDWFDPSQHPELKDVASNSYMVGVMLLEGSPSVDTSDSQSAIISKLLNFGIS